MIWSNLALENKEQQTIWKLNEKILFSSAKTQKINFGSYTLIQSYEKLIRTRFWWGWVSVYE